jgi:hypothetical protein
MANHGGDGVDERLGDGASDFGWKPAEVIALLGTEGNRVIAIVVDAPPEGIAGPSLFNKLRTFCAKGRGACGTDRPLVSF